ncbi:hypothetical protein R5R35_000365 [Gryllus longicercus]|uniref:Uncharacterized protein n=1 Tax=Gryllus longicercus TaxID=2509291 RepID=A0AAN9WMC8_9ORTH
MKKVNNSEDLKDDSDELQKKNSLGDAVTDQMVPIPENRLLRKECEDIESNNEKNNDVSTGNKDSNKVFEVHDPLFASSMYEDVNSPEDFDDYDDNDDDETLQENCSARKTTLDTCNAVENMQENDDVVESIQKCYDAGEIAQNCFSAEEQSQNSFDAEKDVLNCFDSSEPIQDSLEAELSQGCFDAEETAHDSFSAEKTTQECSDPEGVVKDSFDEAVPEEGCCDASETVEDSNAGYEDNFVIQETFEVGEASIRYNQDRCTENYTTECVEEPFVSEDSSSPLPDNDLTCQEMSPVVGAVPTVGSVVSVEDDIDGDADEQAETEEEEEGNTEVIQYTFNTEERGINDSVKPGENFVQAPEEKGIVPEVEDVTCDSGGETVLVMNHKVCSEECDVSKPNVCTEEEIMYTDHLNSVQSVDEMIFHKRSTVIDTGNMCASLHVSDSSAMKSRDNSLVCELPQREAAVVRYCEDYGAMDVSPVFPKRVCNSVCISPIPQPPVRELYVYDPSAHNMTFCRNNTIIDARSLPVNPNVNGLDTYSFHQIPVESSSGVKNINDTYVHTNSGFCPVLQESRFEFENRDVKPTKKLPTEEDFMRRIEKTLFESKIETKIDDTIDSKYKAELDLSLPLKKRLRTLAAMSSISCTPEKFVTPKEESFPSYPVKPMISIAELEFTEGLIPKPGKTYQGNYK